MITAAAAEAVSSWTATTTSNGYANIYKGWYYPDNEDDLLYYYSFRDA